MTPSMQQLRFAGQGDDGTVTLTFMHQARRTAHRCHTEHRNLRLARGEQPRQPGLDAGEALLGVGGGVAGGGAEGSRGGEGTLGVLGFGKVIAVVGDEELEAELIGRGGGQRSAPPQLAHLTAK